MDPSVYPDPEKFIPERWLSDSFLAEAEQQGANPYKAKGDPFVHLAFGAGPRSCFGRKFALLEMKMMVYVLLQQFRLVDSGIPLELEFRFGLVSKDKKLQLALQPL
jgi:cytochrome P450